MKSQLVSIENLDPDDRAAMYTLLDAHFKGVNPETFAADLARKNWVILLKDDSTQILQGFSTLFLQQTMLAQEPCAVVYSGDTIVDPGVWTSSTLARSWIAAVNQLRQQYTQGKLFWLLICSGYRTYRFLPIFWREFYPRYNEITPPHISAFMAFLADSYYQQAYDSVSGIVRLAQPQILRESLIGIPAGRQSDPHIRFFEAKNPGYLQGDELVCLTEIQPDNLTRAGQRMWFAQAE